MKISERMVRMAMRMLREGGLPCSKADALQSIEAVVEREITSLGRYEALADDHSRLSDDEVNKFCDKSPLYNLIPPSLRRLFYVTAAGATLELPEGLLKAHTDVRSAVIRGVFMAMLVMYRRYEGTIDLED